ncbi:MAG: 3'-5' exonuclease, partial [Gammaproteobacteria bacterium]
LRFQQDFPGARRVQLTRNYRSGQSIVAASSQMITPSTLVEDREVTPLLEDTGKLVIHHAPTDRAEAEFVVQTIEQMIGGVSFFSLDSDRSDGERTNEYSFADFAVLYRTEAQADVLEEALQRSGFPFQRHAHKSLDAHPAVQALLALMERTPSHGTVKDRLERAGDESGEGSLNPVIGKLKTVAERCDDRWEQFLSELHLGQEIDVHDERADRCSLLTLHAAKGLEFPVVFITGCDDGILPLRWGDALSESVLAEERRLFYVGMTRTRERLFLSHAAKRLWRGKVREQQPSRFLKDIEERLLEIRRHSYSRKESAQSPQFDLF